MRKKTVTVQASNVNQWNVRNYWHDHFCDFKLNCSFSELENKLLEMGYLMI